MASLLMCSQYVDPAASWDKLRAAAKQALDRLATLPDPPLVKEGKRGYRYVHGDRTADVVWQA